MGRIRELVLTGGPCGGKTTAIGRISDAVASRGWRVLRVPEAATMLICGGVPDIAALADDLPRFVRFQQALAHTCVGLRDSFRSLAAALGDDTLIVYDRAELDALAYMGAEAFSNVAATLGTTPQSLRARYDAVVHLRTAADGAEWAYTTANNEARHETPEQARALDAATLAAWLPHPRLVVVGNDDDFDTKMARVTEVALRLLEDPVPVEIERKFLLATAPDLDAIRAACDVVTFDIAQIYLPSPEGTERRVRRQVLDGDASYVETVKAPTADPRVRSEDEFAVGYDRWIAADASNGPRVVKRRHVFVAGSQRFELDELLSPRTGWLLEVELASADETVNVPDFLDVDREVTDDPTWRNAAVAADAA